MCDGAVAALLSTKAVDGAVVGADRVAANGDTANKIGTYQVSAFATLSVNVICSGKNALKIEDYLQVLILVLF